MADNTDLLNQIRQVVREENEPIKKRLDEQGRVIAQVKTGVEALAAGQSEIKETIATKADVMDLGAKIDKVTKNHETRIRELEEDRGIHHRNKN